MPVSKDTGEFRGRAFQKYIDGISFIPFLANKNRIYTKELKKNT
jgi:hypothetical protein